MGVKVFRLCHVTKLYGGDQLSASRLLAKGVEKSQVFAETGCIAALWDVNLEIEQGEIFVIIGLSGCGKSSLLRCLNRLNEPTDGEIFFEDSDILKFSGRQLQQFRRSKITMVFQHFGLLGHRDVLSNVAYPLEVRGVQRAEREAHAKKFLDMVGLQGHEHTMCDSLSGGMRQRVGIARAL